MTRLETVFANLSYRCDFNGGTNQEALLHLGQFFWHDVAFIDFVTPLMGQIDNGPTGDPVQETISEWCMNLAIFDEKDI